MSARMATAALRTAGSAVATGNDRFPIRLCASGLGCGGGSAPADPRRGNRARHFSGWSSSMTRRPGLPFVMARRARPSQVPGSTAEIYDKLRTIGLAVSFKSCAAEGAVRPVLIPFRNRENVAGGFPKNFAPSRSRLPSPFSARNKRRPRGPLTEARGCSPSRSCP